jgi:molybdopterin/thiamine biosynthesis adenylyltransferase
LVRPFPDIIQGGGEHFGWKKWKLLLIIKYPRLTQVSEKGTVISNLSPAEVTRYALQISLEGWGRQAQERLKASQILMAGAGGLASATALYLLAGGIGAIRLVDDSRVSLADLSHQVLFRERDLDRAKATVAERRLKEINPFVTVASHVKALSEYNVFRLSAGCNLLIDASNKPGAGNLLNLAAVRQQIPLVHGWICDMTGRLATFWPGQGPCLACGFLEPPSNFRPALLSPLPGIIGTLLALEVLRILGGMEPSLLGRVLIFKGNEFKFCEETIRANPQCPVCRGTGSKRRLWKNRVSVTI